MHKEMEYTAVFRVSPTPTLILLPNAPLFTIVDANDSYLTLTNKQREELLGKGFFEVFPTNPYLNDNEWKKSFDAILSTKQAHKLVPQKFASPAIASPTHIDIKYLEIQHTPVLDDCGEIQFIVRSMTDVTESVNHGKFLQETQQAARIGSWEINRALQTISWSQELREIFEMGPEYPLDFHSAMAFYSDTNDRKALSKALQKATHDGTIFRIALPVTTAKGHKRWILTIGKAELVNGICVRIYGTAQDITEKKNTEEALISSEHKFHNLIQTIDGVVWEADAETFEATFISDKVKWLLGYTADEWLADPGFWEKNIYEADRENAVSYCQKHTKKSANHTFDYRMVKKNGDIIWIKDIVSVISESNKPRWLRGIMVDITEAKRFAELNQLERTILELNEKKDASIEHILSTYVLGIEALFPGMACSINQIRNGRLFSWIAPSLPTAYLQHIHNLPIGEYAGSCGSAAYTKKPVIVADIANNPLWADFKEQPLNHGLKSCWSSPVVNAQGEVVAVFGIYYKHIRNPNEDELAFIDRAGAFLNMILENHHHAELAQETTLMMQQGQALAHLGTWQWDIESDHVTWSDTLFDIYGLDKAAYTPGFSAYLSRVHADDRQRVYDILHNAIKKGKDTVFEERIVRPEGEIRHLRSWAKLVLKADGSRKMIGACLDITEAKLAELALNKLHAEIEQQLKIVAESEKKYSNLFHLSPQPMWVYDLDTYRFLDVNDAAIKHYGYTREEFLAMTIRDIRPPEEIPKMEAAVAYSKQHDELFTTSVYVHRKKSGERIYVEVKSNIIKFHGRKAEVILAHDISEKLDYIQAIEAQNKKLQDIAWMQSHVVRAPLARIMGLADLIQHCPDSGIESDELLGAINDSATELDNILRDITDKTEQISR